MDCTNITPPHRADACCVAVPAQEISADTVIENRSQLIEYLESGGKPPGEFRLGAEQEQFVYRTDDLSPAVYDGSQPGIRRLLESLTRFGWQSVEENGLPIALRRGASSITLEPGGQVELSGAPFKTVHEIYQETKTWHDELRVLSPELGLSFLAIGHQPKHRRAELPWMPKQRYEIMREWMPRQGSLGLDMMQGTSSLQVTTDFASEADMVKKFRVALALQPVATVLFANSPFAEGKFSGYLSLRNHIWSDTDPQRSGSLPFVFEKGMGFERYVDYALDVPMYFVNRDGGFVDASGQSFRDFLVGRLPALPGQPPLISDWVNHLTTVFPDVRLKRFLEMRGADAGRALSRVPALAALWAGVLYDSDSLDAAWERVTTWTAAERTALESGVARYGFKTPLRDGTIRGLARWMIELSRQGLQRRRQLNDQSRDESVYLEPLQAAIDRGQTFAEVLLDRFEQQWQGDIDVAMRTLSEETLA